MTYQLIINLTDVPADQFDIDYFIYVLIEQHVQYEQISEIKESNTHSIYLQFQDKLHAEEIHAFIKDQFPELTLIEEKNIDEEEWRDRWKKDFKSFRLTNDFWIVPIWENDHNIDPNKVILMDTTTAFGTGLHETTKFMAELITEHKNQVHTFLDIGTGAGLLGMIARKYDNQRLVLCDIQPESESVVNENFKNNHLTFDQFLLADISQIELEETFDYVAANIITDVLLEKQDTIKRFVKNNGLLAVSGISLSSLSKFKENFNTDGFKLLAEKNGEAWCALLYQRQ